jgi:hypothetical protein
VKVEAGDACLICIEIFKKLPLYPCSCLQAKTCKQLRFIPPFIVMQRLNLNLLFKGKTPFVVGMQNE